MYSVSFPSALPIRALGPTSTDSWGSEMKNKTKQHENTQLWHSRTLYLSGRDQSVYQIRALSGDSQEERRWAGLTQHFQVAAGKLFLPSEDKGQAIMGAP